MSLTDENSDQRLKQWVENWKILGPQLESLRNEEIRKASTREAIQLFDLAFKSVLRNCPPREDSGLVEFHRLLNKLPRR